MHPRLILTIIAGLCLTPVIGEFFVEWARESGAYDNPSEKVSAIMNAVVWLLDQLWFWAAVWFFGGGAIGMWANHYWEQRSKKTKHKKPPIDDEIPGPSEAWRHVDELELWQIANLWVGKEPQNNVLPGTPEYPILRMLKTDVTNYKLLSAEDCKPGIHMHAAGDTKVGVNINTIVKRNTLLHYICNHENRPLWDFGIDDSEPVHQSSRIRMAEAVIDAYRRTPQSFIATLARESGDIAKCYAHEITKRGDIKLYGRMHPSKEIVEIPTEDFQEFMFSDDANELHDQFHKQIKYVDLEISMADLARKIKDINDWRDRG